MLLSSVLFLVSLFHYSAGNENVLFLVKGKVHVPNATLADWIPSTDVHINGGNFQGFLRNDGSFTTSLPAGSYIFAVNNPTYQFTVQSVDVSSDGNITAQTINYLYPDNVTVVAYPLVFESVGRIQYFDVKYEFRFTDILMSRMVLMMFLPMIIMLIALQFVDLDDPEVKEELNSLNLKERLPDMAELIVKLTGKRTPDSRKRKETVEKAQEEVNADSLESKSKDNTN